MKSLFLKSLYEIVYYCVFRCQTHTNENEQNESKKELIAVKRKQTTRRSRAQHFTSLINQINNRVC